MPLEADLLAIVQCIELLIIRHDKRRNSLMQVTSHSLDVDGFLYHLLIFLTSVTLGSQNISAHFHIR